MLIQADTLIFSDFIRMVNFKMIHKYILYHSVETVATHTLITSPFFSSHEDTYKHACSHTMFLCAGLDSAVECQNLGTWGEHLSPADASCEMLYRHLILVSHGLLICKMSF